MDDDDDDDVQFLLASHSVLDNIFTSLRYHATTTMSHWSFGLLCVFELKSSTPVLCDIEVVSHQVDVLNAIIEMAKFLDQIPNAVTLVRQFCDHILINPALWIHTKTKVQVCLYTYLATEFVSSPTIQTSLRRVSTVLLITHALKYYYWVVNPQPRSGLQPKGIDGHRPTRDEILSLRAFILLFLKQLVTRSGKIEPDELQSILGYLLTMHEDENLLDVLQLLVAMMSENGSSLTPVFENLNGISVVFKLLASTSDLVRIHTLKLLAYFLKQSKRKAEIMDSENLFMLISERLLLYPDEIGIPTYNALYDVMVETPCTQVIHKPHHEPSPDTLIHNPAMMKVIANMLRQCNPSPKIQVVKLLFLQDLLTLFQANRDNRRTLLQQSVWQDWMLSLGFLFPKTVEEHQCQDLVYKIFRVLLFHAIKLEWGGWRVWVDTLAIVHSKVSFEEHKNYLEKMYEEYKKSEKRIKKSSLVYTVTGAERLEPNHLSPSQVALEDKQELDARIAGDSTVDREFITKHPSNEEENKSLTAVVSESVVHAAQKLNEELEKTPSEPVNVDDENYKVNNDGVDAVSDTKSEKAETGDFTEKPECQEKEERGDLTPVNEDAHYPGDKSKVDVAESEDCKPSQSSNDADLVEKPGCNDEKQANLPTDHEDQSGKDVDIQAKDESMHEPADIEVSQSTVDQNTLDNPDTNSVDIEDSRGQNSISVLPADQTHMKLENEKEDGALQKEEINDQASAELTDRDLTTVSDHTLTEVTNHASPEVTDHTSPEVTDHTSPEITSHASPEITDHTLPEVTDHTSPEVTGHTSPEVTNRTSPKVTDHTSPEVTDLTSPEVTEHTSPEVTEHTSPDATDHISPGITEHISPVATDHTSPVVIDHTSPEITDHTSPEVTDHTSPVVIDHTSPEVTDYTSPEVTEPKSLEITDDTSQKIADQTSPKINNHESPEMNDHASPVVNGNTSVLVTDHDSAEVGDHVPTDDKADAAVLPTGHQNSETKGSSSQKEFSPGPRTVVFQLPEFRWSDPHLRLLDDLFLCLEGEIHSWKNAKVDFLDVVNSSENLIFLHNTIHVVSQLSDNAVLACGGILPILSSATSPNYELDSIEAGQGLSMEAAWSILDRIVNFLDVLALSSTINLNEIETDKNMQSGGIMRQCLRVACMCAVRNCLEIRYLQKNTSFPPTPKYNSKFNGSINHEIHEDKKEEAVFCEGTNVSAVEAARILLRLMPNKSSPITDPLLLLQADDIERLRGTIYRDVDDTKQTQFLALSVVYFVSVLMVSKYRDILDPESFTKLQQATVAKHLPSTKRRRANLGARFPSKSESASTVTFDGSGRTSSREDHQVQEHASKKDEVLSESEKLTSANVQDVLRNLAKPSAEESNGALEERLTPNNYSVKVTSIQSSFHSFDRSVVVKSKASDEDVNISGVTESNDEVSTSNDTERGRVLSNGEADHTDLPQIDPATVDIADNHEDISFRLERSMNPLAPLLRDIFLDFASYLSKTLLGSHGQELLVEGLVCMRSYTSVVEVVMLLCSQEWQNSIQKNAGLAFIELINEGRLVCHAMKDHVVKVAKEAEFILSKQRAEDVKKHAHFGSTSAIHLSQQRDEEKQCDGLITAAKHRDRAAAQVLQNRITNILTNKLGAWGSNFTNRSREYWMLDSWEDDTRRRRRFVRNPYGSSHKEAILDASQDAHLVPDAAEQGLVTQSPSLSAQKINKLPTSVEDDIGIEDIDMDELLQGPVSFSTESDLIAPGFSLHGIFSISSEEFFFEVNEQHPSFVNADPKVLIYVEGIHGKWLFQEVRGIFSRRYLLQNTAMEIFLANRTSIMFNFPNHEIVKKIVAHLPAAGIGTGYGLPQEKRISLAPPRFLLKSSNMTDRWQRREISNFEYLMFLNTIAGRTFNDLNQYPVFPWILSNYDSNELDLTLASNFRDLSKPVGALNPKRSAFFQSRYDDWDDPTTPKFHYGTHYSNAAFSLGWLLRVEPFSTMFLSLQGGRFDHADRTFHSILQSWKNCQRDSHDVKELIPEFFFLPEMFLNLNDYELGSTNDGVKVDHVILPPWAKSADDFVQIHRLALESEIVSSQIHQWIDLIFGFKQRGPEALRAVNVFYYLTYEGSIDLDLIKDPVEKEGILSQIKNFGQTPSQLLSAPHPLRNPLANVGSSLLNNSDASDVLMVLKFQSNSPVVHLAANTHPSLITPAIVTCTKNLHFCINKWNDLSESKPPPTSHNEEASRPRLIDPDSLSVGGLPVKRHISDMLDQSVKVHSGCFVITADNRFMATCGYWDRSFRITFLDSAKLHQVVFGHWDVVTCLTRSETYIGGDCYIVSGSRDATLMLWYWSGRKSLIIGDTASADENPLPRAVLTGHDTEITCASVCAELGLIASGSLEGPILLHTITGDLLRTLEPDDPSVSESLSRPEIIVFTGEGTIIVSYGGGLLCNFTMNGRSLKRRVIDDNIQAMLTSNDSQFLVTGGDQGVLRVWRAWNFEHLHTYPQCDAEIRSIGISHDQKVIITGMTSGSIVAFAVDFNKWHYEYENRTVKL